MHRRWGQEKNPAKSFVRKKTTWQLQIFLTRQDEVYDASIYVFLEDNIIRKANLKFIWPYVICGPNRRNRTAKNNILPKIAILENDIPCLYLINAVTFDIYELYLTNMYKNDSLYKKVSQPTTYLAVETQLDFGRWSRFVCHVAPHRTCWAVPKSPEFRLTNDLGDVTLYS